MKKVIVYFILSCLLGIFHSCTQQQHTLGSDTLVVPDSISDTLSLHGEKYPSVVFFRTKSFSVEFPSTMFEMFYEEILSDSTIDSTVRFQINIVNDKLLSNLHLTSEAEYHSILVDLPGFYKKHPEYEPNIIMVQLIHNSQFRVTEIHTGEVIKQVIFLKLNKNNEVDYLLKTIQGETILTLERS